MRKAKRRILTCAMLGLPALAAAQPFSKADSGWVPLFNGVDFKGLYSRMYNQAASETIDPVFKAVDGAIKVSVGGGHLGTLKKYSHYRMRVEYRFDQDNPGHNAGLMYHVDESVARMNNKWSRSIECQMKQNETGSAFSIQQVTFTTKVTAKGNFSPYSPNGVAVQVCASGCDGRNFKANPVLPGGAHWMKMELVVRGSDSAAHRVNDTTVFRLWNIRIFNASDTPDGPHGSGGIALQAEGSGLTYRNWEVMELLPGGPDYLTRLLLSAPDQGEKIAAQSTYRVAWRTLGKVGKVSLQYNTGTGWKPMADSIDNTGSFDWKVPSEATQQLRVRVGGPSWVAADSSDGDNAITTPSAVLGLRTPGRKDGPMESRRLDGRLLPDGAVHPASGDRSGVRRPTIITGKGDSHDR